MPMASLQPLTILQIDLVGQVHLAGDCAENQTLLAAIGERELDLAIKATRAQQSGIECVGTVGGHDDLCV